MEASKTSNKRKRKATSGSFKPGNKIGKGRPKNADSIAVFVRTFLEEKNRRQTIIQHAYERALDEDDPSSKQWADFLFNRAYGTPVNTLELTGKDGEPIDIYLTLTPEERKKRIKELEKKRNAAN